MVKIRVVAFVKFLLNLFILAGFKFFANLQVLTQKQGDKNKKQSHKQKWESLLDGSLVLSVSQQAGNSGVWEPVGNWECLWEAHWGNSD